MKEWWKKYSWLIALMLLGLLVFSIFKGCQGSPKPFVPVNVKPQQARRAVAKKEANKQDSIRKIYLDRWHIIREKAFNDTTPCGNEIKYIIQKADTIIKIDSIEIAQLRNIILIDDTIQNKQAEQILKDSLNIVKLNKKVRRNRTIAKLAFITGLGFGGAAGIKISK